jgi:hypothetical protein
MRCIFPFASHISSLGWGPLRGFRPRGMEIRLRGNDLWTLFFFKRLQSPCAASEFSLASGLMHLFSYPWSPSFILFIHLVHFLACNFAYHLNYPKNTFLSYRIALSTKSPQYLHPEGPDLSSRILSWFSPIYVFCATHGV